MVNRSEGRFDPDDDDDDDHRDHQRKTDVDGSSSSDKRGDYWVRFEDEKSWHRYHIEARKDFFGDDTRPLPPRRPDSS